MNNTLVRKRVCNCTSRANGGDVGDRHVIGTHVPCDGEGVHVVIEYVTNSKVPRRFFCQFVNHWRFSDETINCNAMGSFLDSLFFKGPYRAPSCCAASALPATNGVFVKLTGVIVIR